MLLGGHAKITTLHACEERLLIRPFDVEPQTIIIGLDKTRILSMSEKLI